MTPSAHDPRSRRWLAAGLCALACLAVVPLGCRSMDKPTLEARLLALDKNAPVAAIGLQSGELELEVAGRPQRLQFTWYRSGPRTAGRPIVVLVHGTPGSLFTWTDLVFGGPGFAGLSEDHDVLALDVIGHGTTRSTLPDYSFQRCADFVGAALEALELRDVCLVGQSYGGEFVWRAALDNPQRVTRVVLIDSAGYPRRDDEWLPEEVKLREWWVARWGWIFNSRPRVASALQPHFAEPLPAERLEEMFLACENADNWSAVVDLARDENGARSGELGNLTQPTLLIWGADDLAYGVERFARQFERDLPAARLELVEGSGHYPHEERPAAVAALLREFLLASPDVEVGQHAR